MGTIKSEEWLMARMTHSLCMTLWTLLNNLVLYIVANKFFLNKLIMRVKYRGVPEDPSVTDTDLANQTKSR